MACRVTPDPRGPQADGRLEGHEWGTLTRAVWALSDGWSVAGVTPVAMESPGESGKPVYNLREGDMTVFLVNAAPVKTVPGRKTDRAEARWLAPLRRHGLLQARVIPPVAQRDRRDLPRSRTTLGQERTREVNRVHVVDRLTRRLQHLGYRVSLEPVPSAYCCIFNIGLSHGP
jgi:transposase